MALDPAPKPGGLGIADVSFAAGVRDRLFQEICPAAGPKQIRDGPVDRGERKPFLSRDVVCGEIAVMHNDAFRRLSPQPRNARDGEMSRCWIGIGNPVNCKCRLVRDGDGIRTAIRLRPKHRLPIL